MSSAEILGSSNRKQADFFLWKDGNYTEDDYSGWFGRRKPCIKGSDSHHVNDEIGRLKDHNSQPTDKYCWIKADPTFGGLRQITNEPEARVHIGRLPPKMDEVHNNKTRDLAGASTRRRTGPAATRVYDRYNYDAEKRDALDRWALRQSSRAKRRRWSLSVHDDLGHGERRLRLT